MCHYCADVEWSTWQALRRTWARQWWVYARNQLRSTCSVVGVVFVAAKNNGNWCCILVCCRPWTPDKFENWAGAKQMATVRVGHRTEIRRQESKKKLICLSTDWRKRLALKERKHYVRVQQQTTTIVACIDRLKARFAVKKYAGKRPQTVWGVGSQCTRYKEQLWNSNRQTRAAYSVRACPIETHMDKSQEPFYVKFYRKNADSQMEHPAQAPAFTPTIRTLQCGHTVWEKKTLKRQVCRLPKESGVFVKSHKQKKKATELRGACCCFCPTKNTNKVER